MSDTFQRRVGLQGPQGIVQMPNAAGSNAALAQGMQQLAQSFGGIVADAKQNEDRREVYQADEDARTAVLRDADGNISLEQRDPLSRAGRQYNAGVIKRALDETSTQAELQAVAFRAEAAGDPNKFRELWEGYSTTLRDRTPEWMRPEVTSLTGRLGAGHLGSVQTQAISTERGLQAASYSDQTRALEAEGAGLAAAGISSGPAYESWQSRNTRHTRDGVTLRHITPQQAELRLQATAETTMGLTTLRAAEDAIGSGASGEETLTRFRAQMDRQALPPQVRDRLEAGVRGAIYEANARRAEGRTDATIAWDAAKTRLLGGVPVPPEELQRNVDELERTGARANAAEARTLVAVHSELRTFGTLPTSVLREKRAEYGRAVNRETGTERDVMLGRLTEQMLTRREAAMEADPLGTGAAIYARTVGPLTPLDFNNPASFTAREAQARRIGASEGRSMPVITAPEAAGLKTLLENGGTDQQQQVLAGLRGLSPSTMAATMGAIVGGEGAPPRVQAFAVAAARPALTQDILRGMEAMRAFRPQAVEGNAAEDTVRTRLQDVVGNRPELMSQIGQAARALYTQRHAGLDGTSGLAKRLDPDKFGAIVEELLPTVTVRGGMFSSGTHRIPIPPIITGATPAERQTRFDEYMARMPSSALDGAVASDGRAVTADMVRRQGRLVPVSDGQFEVRIGGFTVGGPGGAPFRLDMTKDWPAQISDAGTGDFRRSLARSEGGGRDLAAHNAEGYVGRYQFGKERLTEMGMYQRADGENLRSRDWNGRITVPGFAPMSLAEFKQNEAAQEAAADEHFARIDRTIDEGGLVGRRLADGSTATRNGLRAVAHLGGEAGMRRFVAEGTDPNDSNGTRLSAYHRRFARTS